MDRLTATLHADGREVRKSNPLEQAKLVFPWGYGVVLANISRKAFAGTELQQEQLARSMGEGHRVIHGVAGSGKTMAGGCHMLL